MSAPPPPPPPPPSGPRRAASRRGANAGARPQRQIQGPHSALTDFLASHNISANQIRHDADTRRAAAAASQQATENEVSQPDGQSAEPETSVSVIKKNESKAQEKKRKKEEEKAIAKIKASKQFKRRHEGVDEHLVDEAAHDILRRAPAKMPGQMENCSICDKRFTVTAYSRAGPQGGLLCPACTKDMDAEDGPAKKKKKVASRVNRRTIASRQLDGEYRIGAKRLSTLCIECVAKHVDDADSLGELPDSQVEKVAQILAKERKITPQTMNLFLRPESDSMVCYEGAKLGPDDYIRIFQTMPHVKHLRLRNAVQFKNIVMDYLLGCPTRLETFSILGANLIDDERWNTFFVTKGDALRTLKVYWTDGHFGDDQLAQMAISCPDLIRLNVSHNQKVSAAGLFHIAKLANLRHLTLEIYAATTSEPYVSILESIGPNLETFSLRKVSWLDDSVLESIHESCSNLRKLRFTENETFTDAGFVNLFTHWKNPGLAYVDFSECRHVDATIPRENPDNIGLCSSGFEALMAHSGETLRHLNIHACRHITTEALERVFDKHNSYLNLTEVDVSFVWGVNDFVVGSIFRSCPNLKTLKIFGNFHVKDVRVPRGKILIGMPTAMGMQIEGDDDYLTPPPEK